MMQIHSSRGKGRQSMVAAGPEVVIEASMFEEMTLTLKGLRWVMISRTQNEG